MSNRAVKPIALLVIVASVVTLAVTLWPRGGNTEVGEVHRADYVFGAGHSYRLQVPTGRLDIEVLPPTDELDGSDVQGTGLDYDDTAEAGHGRSLVALSWSYVADPGASAEGDVPDIELALVAGGRDIDIASIPTTRTSGGDQDAAYVAIDGDGTGMRFDVGFDGVVQHVDVDSGEVDTGLAAALYDEPRWVGGSADCSSAPGASSGFDAEPLSCSSMPVVLAPWRADLGWVEDAGSSWAVVAVSTEIYGVDYVGRDRTKDVDYEPTSGTVAVTLDGEEPVSKQDNARGDGSYVVTNGTYVFSVDGDPTSLEVDRHYEVGPQTEYGARGPTRSFDLHTEVALHPL